MVNSHAHISTLARLITFLHLWLIIPKFSFCHLGVRAGNTQSRKNRAGWYKLAEELQPIIKRKKVIAGGGHHGGAWKVAYADFVTAMMAFFLLMWLLNATTEDQRKGIADYFNPTIPLSRISGGGSMALSGDTIQTQDTLSQSGTGTKTKDSSSKVDDKSAEKNAEKGEALTEQKVALLQEAINDSEAALADHLRVKMSPEGLVIEIVESDGVPLFSVGNAQPSAMLRQLLEIVATSFKDMENSLKIVGHTDASGYGENATYTNWDLSSDRANTARRLIVQSGFPASQIVEVSGKADSDPLSNDIYAAENRRISLTILRKD